MADARHILVDDVWPEDYQDHELIDAVEQIAIEWNELNGTEVNIDNLYYKKDKMLYEKTILYALDCAYRMIGVSDVWMLKAELFRDKGFYENATYLDDESKKMFDSAMDHLAKFNIRHLKNKKDIERYSRQVMQKIEEDVTDQRKENKRVKYVFEDWILPISVRFKLNPSDLYNVTCAMYISYANSIKRMDLANK